MSESKTVILESSPVDTALEELANSDVYLFGHGTASQEAADVVVNQGLHSRHTDLMLTAFGLKTTADDPNAVTHDMGLLHDWPHSDAKYIIAVGIERLSGGDVPHRRYLQSVMQPRSIEDDFDEEYGEPYVVDKKFIAGYFDMNQGVFMRNPDYNPKYDPGLLETTVNEDIQKELKQADPLAGMIGDAAIKHETFVAELPDEHDDVVW